MKSFWFACLCLALVACQAFPTLTPLPEKEATSTLTEPQATEIAPVLETLPVEPTITETTSPTDVPTQPVSSAASFPDASRYTWVKVLGSLRKPLFLTHAGDGSGRKFIVSQAGTIQIWKGDRLLSTPFLDISDRISPQALGAGYTERGLLGLAFHPRYAENGYFYVNYTDRRGATVISRFQVSSDPDQADPQSEFLILTVDQPYANHNGGMLAFGPDGYLYIGMGDGGAAGDPENRAQALDTLLGKLLRIDVDAGTPYAIPASNPFAGGGGLPEIWAYGLRNPWRFCFDALTGDLYLPDVGQNQWEEINFQPASSSGGENYGWDFREASHPYEGEVPVDASLVEPVAEYSHAEGCSVTGGYVYRGVQLPEWQGVYFYGDYCSGRVWGLLRGEQGAWVSQALFETGVTISSFGVDEAGELYLTALAQGEIYRLQAR